MKGDTQDLIKRKKPSRVTITYNVDEGGATREVELPVCGLVVSDLGNSSYRDKFQERKVLTVDRDNFNDVMERVSPKIRITIPNVINNNENEKVALDLQFKKMDDFQPRYVLLQNKVTATLVEARDKLKELLAKIDGNFNLEEELEIMMRQKEKLAELSSALSGITLDKQEENKTNNDEV